MRRISIFAAVWLLIASCGSPAEEKPASKILYTDLAADNLLGNVASVVETPYQTDSAGNAGEMDSCCIEVMDYDENGLLTQWTSKDSKGNVKETGTLSHYENGLFSAQKTTKEGKPLNSFETRLDDKGNYTTAIAYDSAGKVEFYYTGITQNEQGQVLTWKQYDKDSVFKAESSATYDKYRQLSFTMKDSVGNMKNTTATKYNDKGERIEFANTTAGKDSTTTKVTKYTYESHDEMGNWTQRTNWDENGKAKKIVKRVITYRKSEGK